MPACVVGRVWSDSVPIVPSLRGSGKLEPRIGLSVERVRAFRCEGHDVDRHVGVPCSSNETNPCRGVSCRGVSTPRCGLACGQSAFSFKSAVLPLGEL